MLQSTQSCLTWNGEAEATAGKPQVAADVEFYLDIDEATGIEMVHVADPKPQRRQPEFLVRDIARQASKAILASWIFASSNIVHYIVAYMLDLLAVRPVLVRDECMLCRFEEIVAELGNQQHQSSATFWAIPTF